VDTSPGLTITCARSQIAGVIPDVTGPSRGGLATVNWLPMTGCRGSDGSKWSLTQQGTSYLGPHTYATGVTTGNVDDMVFALTGTGTGTGAPGACHALLEGYEGATYTNSGSVLSSAVGGPSLLVTQSTCRDLVPIGTGTNGTPNGQVTALATYSLLPGGYRVTSP
jgi:hypothetical protein